MTADAAAALLGTSPTILSQWEERFGYPVPDRSTDGQQLYPDDMMIALGRELSIASAITRAQRAQAIRLVWRAEAATTARRAQASEDAR